MKVSHDYIVSLTTADLAKILTDLGLVPEGYEVNLGSLYAECGSDYDIYFKADKKKAVKVKKAAKKKAVKKAAVVAALMLFSAGAVQAQTNVVESESGDVTYIYGTVDGEQVTGYKIRSGNVTYGTETVGDRTRYTTEIHEGSETYIYSSDPDPYGEDE